MFGAPTAGTRRAGRLVLALLMLPTPSRTWLAHRRVCSRRSRSHFVVRWCVAAVVWAACVLGGLGVPWQRIAAQPRAGRAAGGAARHDAPRDSANAVDAAALRAEQGGDVERALTLWRESIRRWTALGDVGELAGSLSRAGGIYAATGHPDSALASYRRALALARAVGDQNSKAATLSDIGLVYAGTGRPDSALAFYRRALPLRWAVGDRIGTASTLTGIGGVYAQTGRPDSALAYYRRALPLAQAAGDRRGEAAIRGSIGSAYDATGHPDSALAYYRQAIALARAVGDRGREANTLNNIGLVYALTGYPDSALAYYGRALPLREAVGDRAGEATTLTTIGNVYARSGRPDSALAYYRRALALARTAGDRESEAANLHNIGGVYARTGRADSALADYRRALALTQATGDRAGEAVTLNSIGLAYARTGRPDSALVYYGRALPLREAVGDRGGEATTLNNIGAAYDATGRPDSALAYYRRTLPLSQAAGDRQGEATTLSNIGIVYGATGRPDSALAYFDNAAAHYARVRRHAGGDANAVAFAEQERGTGDAWAHAWLALAARRPASTRPAAVLAALGAAERGRAQGLRDLLAARPGVAVSGLLAATDTLPGADLGAEADAALAPLRAQRAAALYYLVGADTLTTWLLTPDGPLTLAAQAAMDGKRLAGLAAALRAALGVDGARGNVPAGDAVPRIGVDSARRALARALLPPALAQLPAGTELVVVPHGALGLVPFAALPVPGAAPGDTVPLGIRYALRYAPSLRAVAAAEARPSPLAPGSPRAAALVVGDPVMPLPTLLQQAWMRREADTVAARLRAAAVPVMVLVDTAATETAVRALFPAASVVHLSTHALAYGSEAQVRSSYVAFAPDQRYRGLLTVGALLDDVPPLSADLVVLAACQTGLGQLTDAEGMVGFARALLARGARSALVSLWSVDGAATTALVTRFYTHWLGPAGPRMRKAEALRRAQDDLRIGHDVPGWNQRWADPLYWAAFQLVGAG